MKRCLQILLVFSLCVAVGNVYAQQPVSKNSSDILLSMKKLKNTASVLYIAAHPDDENTRLLAYLANERCVRTGYLSLTRGDGGQNLIGDEQGIELGLIRTRELLAARRIDGAEQFFSRAYDFGYSKSPEEALNIWGRDKILSDVVWVIRRFKPDVIITRFPTTGEGGHGHHTASAILAVQAVKDAADPLKFPEQFAYGVKPWKVTRLFWNTFRFGTVNTQNENQLKIDVGGFNPLLGESYGEIAAKSRSEHKSQGFGVAAQRGSVLEYFKLLDGKRADTDLMDDIDMGWSRYGLKKVDEAVDDLIASYNLNQPYRSIPGLLKIREMISAAGIDSSVKQLKLAQASRLLASAAGLYMEATCSRQENVPGDTMLVNLFANLPNDVPINNIKVEIGDSVWLFNGFEANSPLQEIVKIVPQWSWLSQPYWLKDKMDPGAFNVSRQTDIGLAEKPSLSATYTIEWKDGSISEIEKPVQYKHTDPVKGELYEPLVFTNAISAKLQPDVLLLRNSDSESKQVNVEITNQGKDTLRVLNGSVGSITCVFNFGGGLPPGGKRTISLQINPKNFPNDTTVFLPFTNDHFKAIQTLHKISYNHIPDIFYHSGSGVKVVKTNLEISGSRIGYIPGAGDKVKEGLEQMGYKVDELSEDMVRNGNLSVYDAIVTGIRAYNVHPWLATVHAKLMRYVSDGGVMLVQYNTNNNLGTLADQIGPYPFTITRNRITDEQAIVEFLHPNDPLLNFPNKISASDFDGWIQERSIYHAGNTDSHYRSLFRMKDPGESSSDGSLITADVGKGRFIYTGLVFFREIPAGVPGAYRLLVNLLAKPRLKE